MKLKSSKQKERIIADIQDYRFKDWLEQSKEETPSCGVAKTSIPMLPEEINSQKFETAE